MEILKFLFWLFLLIYVVRLYKKGKLWENFKDAVFGMSVGFILFGLIYYYFFRDYQKKACLKFQTGFLAFYCSWYFPGQLDLHKKQAKYLNRIELNAKY